jgi:hypothetical protein
MGFLHWFLPPRCPVEDAETKRWIEERFEWLFDQFAVERLRARVILPTPEFFPDKFDYSPESYVAMFERIRGYMGLAEEQIRLGFYAEEADHRPGGSMPGVLYSTKGTAGLYHGVRSEDGKLVVMVEAKQMRDPTAFVATVAHELGHVLLLGQGRLSRDEPDHEPLTDLLTIFFGLGVFTANANIHESHWTQLNRSGWSVGKHGYLSQREIAYGLALHAWLRGEGSPPWKKHVCDDVQEPMLVGLRWLQRGNGPEKLAGLRTSLIEEEA